VRGKRESQDILHWHEQTGTTYLEAFFKMRGFKVGDQPGTITSTERHFDELYQQPQSQHDPKSIE
jgi:hypothetical protein